MYSDLFATLPNVIVINSRLPPKSLNELIDYAKAHPRELNYGTVGVGSSQHLAAAYFEQLTGTEITHVPYRNIAAIRRTSSRPGPAWLPALAERHQPDQKRRCTPARGGQRQAHDRAAGCTDRSGGGPQVRERRWLALLAPASTGKAVLDRLYAAMAEAVNDPKVRALFVEQGAEPG